MALFSSARRVLLSAVLAASMLPTAAWAIPQLLVDANTMEVLFEEDAGQPWHPASLTKLMTAFVTFQAIAEGRVSLDTPVVLSRTAVSQAPASSGLKADSALSMKDALYVMLVKSANDVAWAIAETVGGTKENFVNEMNATAARMGLTATHYNNPNGLPDDGQVSSARDLAVLALYIRQMYPQYLTIFKTEAVTLGKQRLKTNNDLLTHFAGTTGMKTGYICASGLNIVATVERNGRSLLAVVLGGSSGRERGEMTAQLFLRGLAGALKGTGRSVTDIKNTGGAATDMRNLLCGKGAADYVAQRKAEFPLGLKGQPSYLTDEVHGQVYAATDLGRRRDVPLPLPRPSGAPQAVAIADPEPRTPPSDATSPTTPTVGGDGQGAPIPMPRLDRGGLAAR